jgi:hypothetical protein
MAPEIGDPKNPDSGIEMEKVLMTFARCAAGHQ